MHWLKQQGIPRKTMNMILILYGCTWYNKGSQSTENTRSTYENLEERKFKTEKI